MPFDRALPPSHKPPAEAQPSSNVNLLEIAAGRSSALSGKRARERIEGGRSREYKREEGNSGEGRGSRKAKKNISGGRRGKRVDEEKGKGTDERMPPMWGLGGHLVERGEGFLEEREAGVGNPSEKVARAKISEKKWKKRSKWKRRCGRGGGRSPRRVWQPAAAIPARESNYRMGRKEGAAGVEWSAINQKKLNFVWQRSVMRIHVMINVTQR